MLIRSPLFVLTLGLSVASVACVVTTDDGSGGSGGGSTTTSNTTTTTTGQGGAGGEGGATNGSGGAGGEGGGVACVEHTGVGVAETACADVVGGLECGVGNQEPAPARLVCSRSFEIFTEGARENLIGCLEEIPVVPADVCDETQSSADIAECVNEMYGEACLNDADYLAGSNGVCAEANAACVAASDDNFPAALCLSELNVFSQAGVGEYIDCFNDPANGNVPCNEIHDLCYTQVLSY